MMAIKALYRFKILSTDAGKGIYDIVRLNIFNTQTVMDEFFANHDSFFIKKLSSDSLQAYVGYAVVAKTKLLKENQLIFETALDYYPYGIVRTGKCEDAMMFKIIDDEIFEVYVFDQKRSDTLNYFQLLLDGSLEEQIDILRQNY